MATFKVEIAYTSQEGSQQIRPIDIDETFTLEQAIVDSGLLHEFPEIDLSLQKVGIFGKLANLSQIVKPGDRIEIYRPLLINPKEARRLRAKTS